MLRKEFISRLDALTKRYEFLERELSKPEVVADINRYKALSKELKDLTEVYETYKEYKKLIKEREELKELTKSSEEELRKLAKEELDSIE